jgi:hypothetical protein
MTIMPWSMMLFIYGGISKGIQLNPYIHNAVLFTKCQIFWTR